MTITQSINIPAKRRRITIDIPRELPAGPAILTFESATPSAPAKPVKGIMTDEEEIAYINKHAKRLNKQALESLKYQADIFREHTEEELEILRNMKPSAVVHLSKDDIIK